MLKAHEELIFHYLSILSLLPGRWSDVLNILDVYGKRMGTDTKKNHSDLK
jgi:hypothetical protein